MKLERPAHKQKAEIVAEIMNKLKSNGVAIAEYKHLTVAQMTQLRRLCLTKNIEIKVYKDSLVRRAAKEAGFDALEAFLTQQNVFLFSEDPIAPAKLIANFAKENEKLVLKAGIYEGAVMDTQAINEVASIPSKDELYSMFASSLIYPLRQFMLVTKEVAKTKSE
ncbi:50S ribosomal protein L10 [Williamsoniiplasma luminosum]|uniref:Large ribosomal subunit protein uL10 n=1 Tax=Williamsoniiplasma luminosum TaxID=214888 RepID=A0A2K8NSN1_9MOLU|nr:50S ribosomal protein L10 [Williamsoniiplasma luminosum]ATZ16850.1 50S ribosomal protein L10 [Williamsoniiplasma luminosum]AVP49521.1 MAG: 50S ribosomal protein L10 [Williamsoniiplasma luminosum]